MANVDNLQAAWTNYTLLLLLVTQAVASPTQAKVAAIATAAQGAGILTPKPTSTVDGESYDWVGYQQFIINAGQPLRRLIQDEGGPYQIVTRGVG